MPNKSESLLVLNTCPDAITANNIAKDLVANKLAACVQIIPGIQSLFRWEGKVDSAEEQLLLIKTNTDRYQQLEDKIKALHPYELPEIIAVSISTGFTDYLSWIDDSIHSS